MSTETKKQHEAEIHETTEQEKFRSGGNILKNLYLLDYCYLAYS